MRYPIYVHIGTCYVPGKDAKSKAQEKAKSSHVLFFIE